MKNTRPERTYVTSSATSIVRWLSWLPTLGAAYLLLTNYASLPDAVPTHFGPAGAPDSWGEKWTPIVLLVTLAALQVVIDVLSRHPRVFNYPTMPTPANAQRLYAEGERMMVGVEVAVALLCLGAVASTIDPNSQTLLGFAIVTLIGVTVVGVVRLVRAGRQPSGPVTPGSR